MKKLVSILLILASLLTLTSCADKSKMPKPENSDTVLKINGKKINYDVFRYFYLNAKASIDDGDDSYWENNTEAEERLKNEVLDILLTNEATMKLAKKYKKSLTKKEKIAINEELKSIANVEEELSFVNMTKYSYVYIQRYLAVWEKLYNHIISEESGIIKCDDKTVLADVPVNFRNIRYLMLEFDNTNKAEIKAEAEDFLNRAKNGGDFEKFIKENCDDPYMRNIAGSGYYYTKGQLSYDIEEISQNLEIGQFTDVIELNGAFFIVQRIDINMDYVESNLNKFIDMYLSRCYNDMIEKEKENLKVELTDIWNNATALGIK